GCVFYQRMKRSERKLRRDACSTSEQAGMRVLPKNEEIRAEAQEARRKFYLFWRMRSAEGSFGIMKIKSTWIRIGLWCVLLLLVAGGYIFWPLSEDLSHLADAGAEYEVEILRDAWGVPHIFGKTDADVAFGLAYAHAEDDFLTIQQTAIAARGQLATVYGADAAPNDYMVQLLRIWEVVEANYESQLSAEVRAICEAYAAGLNRYAAQHSDEALPGLFPVSGKDVVAGSVHKSPLFFGLDSTLKELFAEARQNTVSPRNANQSSSSDALPPQNSGQSAYFDTLGSNTFSVAPSRTADGSTFLAVNSHQPWSGPVTWYEAHVHSEEGWDMVGALFPGMPVMTVGHNRDLGWAFTVNKPDLTDVYVLDINPDQPNQYRFDGQWRELEVREAPITVKLLGRLSWTVTEEVLWSVYGPVIRQDHGTYAIRYAGFGSVAIYEQLYRMNKAQNFAAWQDAMRIEGLPMFNVGYADREGNIYNLYNGLLPKRSPAYDWAQYLPGDTSETLWQDYLPFDELPQVLNPPSGFVQNCNSSPFQTTLGLGNPDAATYSPTLGIEETMSNRALRLLELLGGDESITAAEFEAYKYDMGFSTQSAVADFVDTIVNADWSNDSDLQAAADLLKKWDLQTDPENKSAALMILTLHFLNESDDAHIDPSQLGPDTEVERAVLLDSFTQAVTQLKESYGRLDVPWQEVNRLRRGEVDLGVGGAADVPHAVYGELQEDGRFKGIAGDSYILLVQWDKEGNVHSRSIHQYGSATLDQNSPHYADQAPLFVKRELKPVWLDETQIRANLKRAYRPGESGD
ncbi:MAG: penicillin acylase family protein, partial [Ardenticatenaceae bacterium]